MQRQWTPFSTVPRKKSRRVRTIRKVDSDSETLHIEKDSQSPKANLERSCSVDALDEIGDDGEPRSRLRTKRASTQVESQGIDFSMIIEYAFLHYPQLPDKYFNKLNSRRNALLEGELIAEKYSPVNHVLYEPKNVEVSYCTLVSFVYRMWRLWVNE